MPGTVTIVGLGPGDLDRISTDLRRLLLDSDRRLILRTIEHPAAVAIAGLRTVEACDDLYEQSERFEDVYSGIAARVVTAASDGDVLYAVPGSPLVAERSVAVVRSAAATAGVSVEVVPAPSFLDEMFIALDLDPAARGFQLLDGRDLPDPMPMHLPTIVFHVDVPIVMAEVLDRFGRVLPDDTMLTVVQELGTADATVIEAPIHEIDAELAGLRTSLFVDAVATGFVGAVQVMRRLRAECPWDREQTHDSLVPFAVEEVHELAEALAALPPGSPAVEEIDYGAYAEVEDELGDVLLQVIFHANLATEAGAFDIEDVAEQLRRKLIRRHPHVFGDVEVEGAEDVVRNWQTIKAGERDRASLMDGVPVDVPGLVRATKLQSRAARVGFDWEEVTGVLDKVDEEMSELRAAVGTAAAEEELGDVLFAIANAARHLGVEPETALRRAVQKFERRFRAMEAAGPLEGATLDELNGRWEAAKGAEG